MRLAWSMTARLAALFATMASGLLIVVGVAIDRAVTAHLYELDLHDLSAKRVAIETLLATTTSDDALAALSGRIDDTLAGHETVALRLSLPQREWQHAVLDDRFDDRMRPLSSGAGEVRRWRDARGTPFVGQAAFIPIGLPEPMSAEALIGLDISHHEHFQQTLRLRLAIGISIAAVLAAMLGWLAAHKGLAPMRRVTATAHRLSAERLGERLSEDDAPGEMRELVEAFNGMLERPLSQNSCRLVRITNPGAILEERSGEIRTSLQGQSSGAVVAA